MEPSDLKKEIGEWIKWVRKARGDLTQDELSEKTGIHKQQISRYERGLNMPRKEIIDKISEYGGIPLSLFIAEQKISYGDQTIEHKKLLENVKEILESGNEKAIEALMANIEAFLEMVRVSKKGNENKGGKK